LLLGFMKQTPLERKITEIIDPVVKDLGFDVVQVRLIGSQKLQTLQILAENPATGRIDLNGCTAVSRAVSAILDVEDPIPGAYQLEVSSPGIDRPLVRAEDFLKNKEKEISIETDIPQDNGQKRFKGVLKDFANDTLVLQTADGDAEISIGDIIKAKLVLTEELVMGKPKGQKKTLNAPKKKKNTNITNNPDMSQILESEEV